MTKKRHGYKSNMGKSFWNGSFILVLKFLWSLALDSPYNCLQVFPEILVSSILRRRLQKMSSAMRSSRTFLATPLLHMTKSCETSMQISSAFRILLETLVPYKAFKCLLYLLSYVLFFYTRVVWEHVYMAGFCIFFFCYFHHKYTKSFFISFSKYIFILFISFCSAS